VDVVNKETVGWYIILVFWRKSVRFSLIGRFLLKWMAILAYNLNRSKYIM
jgi:hypothetical protein